MVTCVSLLSLCCCCSIPQLAAIEPSSIHELRGWRNSAPFSVAINYPIQFNPQQPAQYLVAICFLDFLNNHALALLCMECGLREIYLYQHVQENAIPWIMILLVLTVSWCHQWPSDHQQQHALCNLSLGLSCRWQNEEAFPRRCCFLCLMLVVVVVDEINCRWTSHILSFSF